MSAIINALEPRTSYVRDLEVYTSQNNLNGAFHALACHYVKISEWSLVISFTVNNHRLISFVGNAPTLEEAQRSIINQMNKIGFNVPDFMEVLP